VTAAGGLPPGACALALASLPGMGTPRLAALLDAGGGDPVQAWALVKGPPTLDLDLGSRVGGRGGGALVDRWREAARTMAVERRWAEAIAAGIGVWWPAADGYPPGLAGDPDPPPVLFHRGAVPGAVGAGHRRPAVAIVGTRRCTSYGSDVARELGRDLAAAGITVVSGLALGIDGAAHEGALAAVSADDGRAAPPAGVVGSGLDVVYPPRHRRLWQRVAEAGVLLSEAPPGAAPDAWRFPRRNRILAALASVVVVVESHASGGSMSTVRAAIDRGIPVMAVPGSVRSASSAGTNRLLADGVAPVTDATDVLVALSLEGVQTAAAGAGGHGGGGATDAELDDPLLAAVDWTPTATEDVLRRTGLSIEEAATQLTRLEVAGLVRRRGGWWERVMRPGAATLGGYTATT
jgi:DNA processing protein